MTFQHGSGKIYLIQSNCAKGWLMGYYQQSLLGNQFQLITANHSRKSLLKCFDPIRTVFIAFIVFLEDSSLVLLL